MFIILLLIVQAVYIACKDYPGVPDSHYCEFYIGSPENKFRYGFNMTMQYSMISQESLGKEIISVVYESYNYILQPFFDREVCLLVGRGLPDYPPYLFPSKMTYNGTYVYNGIECDYYIHSHLPIEDVTEYVYMKKDTDIPVEFYIFVRYYSKLEKVVILNYTSNADSSIFEPPNRCKSLMADEKHRALNRDKLINEIYSTEYLNQPLNNLVNNYSPKTYTVQQYDRFNGVSIKDFMNTLLPSLPLANPFPKLSNMKLRNNLKLPESYDWSIEKPNCEQITKILDQGSCGSCWSFGAIQTYGSRYCIKSNKSILFSAQDLVDCDTRNGRCNGGFSDNAWSTIKERGISTDQCKNYTSGISGLENTCNDQLCNDNSSIIFYKSKNIYTPGYDEIDIMNDIYNNGPIQTNYYVFDDFQNYKNGIYKRQPNSKLLGGHSVVINGWGIENDIKYWKVKNSWGEDWGENGYFRIVRGTNDCAIEDFVGGGDADI